MKICYTVLLVGFMVHFTFDSVLCIYGIISYLYNRQPKPLDFIFCSTTIIWQIYIILFFVWIFIFSNLIAREGKRIEMAGHRIAGRLCNKQVNKRVILISMQFHHRRPLIECGIYNIDWKLLFFIIGSIFFLSAYNNSI